MSNQLQITGDLKVKSLTGALTATAGVVSSVPLGTANGVATLGTDGKVPSAQLPTMASSYKGTWNAATNTPTIADGVGTAGDYYLVSTGGTFNGVVYVAGNTVIYSGTVWQRAGGGTGTVTSVGLSAPAAFSITGSPITGAGTLAIAGAGTANDYIKGDGTLGLFSTAAIATITGGASTIATSNLDTSKALNSNSSGKVVANITTATELSYLSGVSSNVQTQLDGKGPSYTLGSVSSSPTSVLVITGSGAPVNGSLTFTVNQSSASQNGYLSSTDWNTFNNKQSTISLTANRAVSSNSGGALVASITTATELAYLSGVSSNVQTQLDSKAGTFTLGTVSGSPSGVLSVTGSGGVVNGSLTFTLAQASATSSGYLSSADWNTFNNSSTGSYLPLAGGSLTGSLTINDGNQLNLGQGGSSNVPIDFYSSNFGSGYEGRIMGNNGDGNTHFYSRNNNASFTDIGYFNDSGMYITYYGSYSDIRLKDVIETNPDIDLDAIDVIKYTLKSNPSLVRYGYSAQQVQSVLPDLVTLNTRIDGNNEDATLMLNYNDLYVLKIAALEKKMAELTQEVAVLKGKNN
jgi:hypothetical protein